MQNGHFVPNTVFIFYRSFDAGGMRDAIRNTEMYSDDSEKPETDFGEPVPEAKRSLLPHTSLTPRLQTFPTPQPHISPLAHPPPNLPVSDVMDALPSSAITRESLSDRYPKLRSLCKAGSLSYKLAREAIFGENILKRCTPKGNRYLPGLPSKELDDLKRVMFSQYPSVLEGSSGV